MTVSFTFEDEDGEEIVHEFPSTKEVCSNCRGEGTHLTPGMRDHAYSQEDFENEFDTDEQEAYFTRGGRYDVTCESCDGLRVVDVIDESRFSEKDKEMFEIFCEHEKDQAEYDAMCAAERRMGA